VALTVWRLNVGGEPAALDGFQLVPAAPGVPVPDAGGIVRPAPGPGAGESGDPCNTRLRLHVTDLDEARRFAIPFLQERTKQWRVAETAQPTDGAAVIEFEIDLGKSVDLAAFIKAIEQGDPHVTRVELTRMKSKKPKDE